MGSRGMGKTTCSIFPNQNVFSERPMSLLGATILGCFVTSVTLLISFLQLPRTSEAALLATLYAILYATLYATLSPALLLLG